MKRPCCTDGKRHWWFGHWRYNYGVSQLTNSSSAGTALTGQYMVHRGKGFNAEDSEKGEWLCARGHWTAEARTGMYLVSDREAQKLVSRLTAGGPVHRDRWLGLLGILFVVFELRCWLA